MGWLALLFFWRFIPITASNIAVILDSRFPQCSWRNREYHFVGAKTSSSALPRNLSTCLPPLPSLGREPVRPDGWPLHQRSFPPASSDVGGVEWWAPDAGSVDLAGFPPKSPTHAVSPHGFAPWMARQTYDVDRDLPPWGIRESATRWLVGYRRRQRTWRRRKSVRGPWWSRVEVSKTRRYQLLLIVLLTAINWTISSRTNSIWM